MKEMLLLALTMVASATICAATDQPMMPQKLTMAELDTLCGKEDACKTVTAERDEATKSTRYSCDAKAGLLVLVYALDEQNKPQFMCAKQSELEPK